MASCCLNADMWLRRMKLVLAEIRDVQDSIVKWEDV